MTEDNKQRGVIEHHKRKSQTLLFEGIQYKNITPTDIDFLIEYKDKAYILAEAKYGGTEIKPGQRLALERMVNDFRKVGKKAVALIIQHDVSDCNKDVHHRDCIVKEVYLSAEKTWRKPTTDNFKEIIDRFINYIDTS